MAGPRSERFHNRDNGILRNKYRLGILRKNYTGLGLWHQPTNISSTSSSVSRLPPRCFHPSDKVRLLQMAKVWRDLAEKLEASQNRPEASQNRPAEKGSV
jgi:hypothetical protein